MNKTLTISLLLVVGIIANGQIIKGTITFEQYKDTANILDFEKWLPYECMKFTIWDRRVIAYCECGSDDTIVLDPVVLVRNYLEVEKIAWKQAEKIDSLRKEVDSLKISRGPSVIDSIIWGEPHIQNATLSGNTYPVEMGGTFWSFGRNKGSVIADSNGTYHDHMPTQLTVRKRHKRHKWAKRTPPATKD